MITRQYENNDVEQMMQIWNRIVEDGTSFPQVTPLDLEQARTFFAEQSYCGVAEEDGSILGLYILHPNNVGRCGHIANTSYAVKTGCRGKHVGEALVKDSMRAAAALSFKILQFNAVVATNKWAIHLYKKLGFTALGTIPGGFKMPDGSYEDIIPFFITL